MKIGRYFAAVLLAVMVFMAAAGAQDPGPPPSGSQQDPNASQQEPNGAPPEANAPDQDSERPQLQERESSEPKASVARVSLIHGNVSMQRGDSSEWSAVSLNTPLVQGDQIATADRSRTEVQLDFANMMRLAGSSTAKIADLERSRIQVQVSQGYVYYSVFDGNEAEVEIDTPNVAVHPLRSGRYRVQVNSDSETDVIVREGEAEITTPEGSTKVKEGELITIRGTDNPEYKVENAPAADEWDRFNQDRDRGIQSANAVQKTNRYYTGAQDLDAYGRWIYVPGYGNVWQPYSQGPTWAPYQDGRWVWEPSWGWTWVSYEPWGWAPYHYGRWFYWNTGWVWWPGPVYPWYRPLWAPAYVSFFGFGGHVGFGFGFGFGSVGWLPCGPFDPFFPWYGRGFTHVTVVNINNFNVRGFHGPFVRPLGIAGRHPFISNISMVRTNARVRAGITSVSGADFARGGMGSRRFGVDAGQLREGRMMTGNVPVVPTRESLHSGNMTRPVGAGSQPRVSSRFVTRGGTPAGPPAFHEQAAQMERVVRSSGGALGGSSASSTRFGNEASRGGATPWHSPGASGSPIDRGSVRMAQATGADRPAGGDSSRGGWRSFGGSNGSQPQNNSHATSGPAQAGSAQGPDRGGASGNEHRGWSSFPSGSGESSRGRPPLQMAKPIVTPRTSAPSYTYTRPSTPPPASHGPGSYGSPAASSPSPYGGRGTGGSYGSYGIERSNGNYGVGSRGGAYGGYNGGGGRSNGGYSGYGAGNRSSGSYSGGEGRSYGGYTGGGRNSGGGGGGRSGGGSHGSGGGNHSSGGGNHNGGHSR